MREGGGLHGHVEEGVTEEGRKRGKGRDGRMDEGTDKGRGVEGREGRHERGTGACGRGTLFFMLCLRTMCLCWDTAAAMWGDKGVRSGRNMGAGPFFNDWEPRVPAGAHQPCGV